VETIDCLGYSQEYGCYVYPDVAVKDGKSFELNDEDYFEINKLAVKSLSRSVPLHINRDLSAYRRDWPGMVWTAFGPRGLVALTYWFGSLFAEQIRARHKSFPFLEVVGEPASGKSTLIEFLWKLYGRRDYEGFDPSKSTQAARARIFSQLANAPVVLIEGDREEDSAKAKKFDFDELKPLYNGRSVRARGHKNSGNETYEPPFRGTIVVAQNATVNASEAVLQRLVHLEFTKAGHTPATRVVAETLERMPLEEVSGFLLEAVKREKLVLERVFEETGIWESVLLAKPAIKSVRLAKNHAQLVSLLYAMGEMLGLSLEQVERTKDCLFELCAERQQAIGLDHPLVQEFWELVDYLEGIGPECELNHSRDPKLFAINLNHFVSVATKRNQQIPPLGELKQVLKTGRARKYIDQRAVNSAIFIDQEGTGCGKTMKCWVFEIG